MIAALRDRLKGPQRAESGPTNHSRPLLEGRILVVDDEQRIRDVLTDYLEGEGYAVAAVASGEEALAGVRRDPPTLVLLDIKMPGMNGLEVLRRLRRDHPEIPVVMLTGINDEALARSTLQIGAFHHIQKPFTLDQLRQAVSVALGKVANRENAARLRRG